MKNIGGEGVHSYENKRQTIDAAMATLKALQWVGAFSEYQELFGLKHLLKNRSKTIISGYVTVNTQVF